jgi:hypothetical protein
MKDLLENYAYRIYLSLKIWKISLIVKDMLAEVKKLSLTIRKHN